MTTEPRPDTDDPVDDDQSAGSADRWWNRIAETRVVRVLMEAYRAWSADRAPRLGAGLAYYSLFALVPVLFLAISLAGIIFGRDVAGTTLEDSVADAVGAEIADALTQAIDRMRDETMNSLLPIVSFGALLFTATILFVAWKEVVDLIWDLPRESGVLASLQRRLFGVAAVAGAGLFLAMMIFAQTLVGALDRLVGNVAIDVLLKITSSVVPGLLGTLFLVVMFKYTPDTEIGWRSVWPAALVTTVMLAVAAWAYGLYLGTVGFRSASGVAGTLLLGLAFLYYSAQMLLYGVEITKVLHEAGRPRR